VSPLQSAWPGDPLKSSSQSRSRLCSLRFHKSIHGSLLTQPCRCLSQVNIAASSLVRYHRALVFAHRSDSPKARPGVETSGLLFWMAFSAIILFLALGSIAKLRALLCCDDCVAGALAKANLAAVTAMHVNKGWLVKVNTHNGFDLTHLLRQTAPASLAAVVVNVKHSLANGGTYQRQYSHCQIRCISARKVTRAPR
jgi:hypothetical protein